MTMIRLQHVTMIRIIHVKKIDLVPGENNPVKEEGMEEVDTILS